MIAEAITIVSFGVIDIVILKAVRPKSHQLSRRVNRCREGVPIRDKFVVLTSSFYPAEMDRRYIVMLSVFVVIKGVIPISAESGKVGFVRFGKLYRPENVITHGEIVVRVAVAHRERIYIRSLLHIRLQSGEDVIRSAVSVRLSACIVNKTCVRRSIVSRCRRQCKSVSQELNRLEIVSRRVVVFVFHPVNNALAVGTVCPSEASGIVVKAILEFPRFRVSIGSVRSVVGVSRRSRVLVQMGCAICRDDNVEPSLFG